MYNAIEYVYIKIGVSLNKKVSKFQSLLKITTRYVLLKLILDKLFYDFILFHFLLIDSPDHNMCLAKHISFDYAKMNNFIFLFLRMQLVFLSTGIKGFCSLQHIFVSLNKTKNKWRRNQSTFEISAFKAFKLVLYLYWL